LEVEGEIVAERTTAVSASCLGAIGERGPTSFLAEDFEQMVGIQKVDAFVGCCIHFSM
jgi:hypothetical protein